MLGARQETSTSSIMARQPRLASPLGMFALPPTGHSGQAAGRGLGWSLVGGGGVGRKPTG